jgi:hypothetical protein
MTAQFAEGQEVIWTGLARKFARTVRIVAVRRSYSARLGERPEDGKIFYDIADPTIEGTVFAIPADQLEIAPEASKVSTCPQSERPDGDHSWKFDGDDPYVLCAWCEERQDALTGRIITPGHGSQA